MGSLGFSIEGTEFDGVTTRLEEGNPLEQVGGFFNFQNDFPLTNSLPSNGVLEEGVRQRKNGKKVKCARVKEAVESLILGVGIGRNEIMESAGKALVSWVRGGNYSAARLNKWAMEEWAKYINSLTLVRTLTRGLYTFIFIDEAKATWVLSKFWNIEMVPIFLKDGHPSSTQDREHLGEGLVWV